MKKSYFTVASNTVYQILGRLISALVAVLITRLLTAYLGIEGFGGYQIVIAYVTFLWILTDFGQNAVAVRRMAEEPQNLQETFSLLLTTRSLIALMLFLFLNLLSLFLPYSAPVRMGISVGSLTILLQGVRGAAGAVFQFKLKYGLQLISEILSSACFLGFVYTVVKMDLGLVWVAGVLTAQYFISSFFYLIFASRWVRIELEFDFNALKELIRKAFPFGIALLFSLMISKVDTFLLSLINNQGVPAVEAVAHYNLGFKVFEFVLAVPIFFMNVVYPMLVKKLSQKKEYFANTFRKCLLILFNLALWGGIALYTTAPYLIDIIAEDVAVRPAIRVLRSLSAFTPVFFITALLMWTLVVFKKQKELIWVYARAFILSITLNLIFIPRFSYMAPTVIKGITEIFVLAQLARRVYIFFPK